MPKFNVTQAAKLYGKDRRTLQRHISKGVLSCGLAENGQRFIDLSELMRVYGEPPNELPENAALVAPSEKTDAAPLPQVVLDEISALRREVQALRNELKYLPSPKAEKTSLWQRIKAVFKA